jgi:hypothetical protein
MSSSSESTTGVRPIVVVGKEAKISKMVNAKLLPEYEGITNLKFMYLSRVDIQ